MDFFYSSLDILDMTRSLDKNHVCSSIKVSVTSFNCLFYTFNSYGIRASIDDEFGVKFIAYFLASLNFQDHFIC